MGIGIGVMKSGETKKLKHRVAAALSLLVFPSVLMERAQAACSPSSPVNNAIVDCIGTTINSSGNAGYGNSSDTGNTITVESGATVTGDVSGLLFNDGTVFNNGAVAGGDVGVFGVFGTATVTNNTGATISGPTAGIVGAQGVILTNDGTVESTGTTANNAFAVLAQGGTATVNNIRGTIRANDAVGAVAIQGPTVVVTGNRGTIEAMNTNGRAINAVTGDANVTNLDGIIRATGSNGIAINANRTAIVNSNSGFILGDLIAVSAPTVIVSSNFGEIEATGAAGGQAINAVTGNATVTNSGLIAANNGNGVAITAVGTITVNNLNVGTIQGATFGIQAAPGVQTAAIDITNATGATISGGTTAIEGAGIVRNAGSIVGGTNSVVFTGAGTNTLILQTGSVLNGEAVGSAAAGATNNLVLQGHGTASNVFSNFNSLDVQADTAWVWESASPTVGTTTISSGTFVLNQALQTTLTVNNGGTLAGQGGVTGNITVAGGGTIAPGAAVPFATLSSGGVVVFQPGSTYRVNVNAAGKNDKLATASATLNGAAVNVLAQNGTYAPSTRYTILTTLNGGLGGTNTFGNVTTNLAFLTPSLSYDANDVFLTLATNGGGGGGGGTGGLGFANVALTRNQRAVAGALDASPVGSPLITALLNQTAAGARQAFDALSGEVFGTLHNTQGEEAQFARSAMLGRMRQMSYGGIPGDLGALGFGGPALAYAPGDAYAADLPVKAVPGSVERSRGLTFWAQGLGGWGHADSDGNAASLRSRFGGFLSGADARFGDTWRAGLVAGYMRSDLHVDARASSAGIDSVQFGGYAAGKLGAFNVRAGASYSLDEINASRGIFFPGFTDQTHARFHGNVGQVFGEVGYGMAFGRVAVEPLAGLAYVHVHDNSFLESGGVAALSGAKANEDTGYSSLGVRMATAMPLANGTVLVPRATLQWQHAFGDVTPVNALAFQSTGTSFTVAGVPIARDAALVEAGFDWRFSPHARLGAFYQGELAAHADTHAVKGTFTWDF
jgi:outer membrane autotransporter protein